MIEAIKRHWKSIVLTVLVIITLVGICLSIYQGGYCVTSKFAGNVEAKLNSVSLNDTTVSYEKYMSMYSGVTSVVGNYITGIAAFLTLLLLAAQFYEIRESKMRYLEDKRRAKIESEKNDIDRFMKRVSDGILNSKYECLGVKCDGIEAYEMFANNLGEYLFCCNLESVDDMQKYLMQAMDNVIKRFIYVIIAIKSLGHLSKEYEIESRIYFKRLYIIDGDEPFRLIRLSLLKILLKKDAVVEDNRSEFMDLCEMFRHLSEWYNLYDKLSDQSHVDRRAIYPDKNEKNQRFLKLSVDQFFDDSYLRYCVQYA